MPNSPWLDWRSRPACLDWFKAATRWIRVNWAMVVMVIGWVTLNSAVAAESPVAVPLPQGVKAEWDSRLAFRESTPTRELVCLNGLWQWQPAGLGSETLPDQNWGWFKVPGCWPGITDYMQKDSQLVFRHPVWAGAKLGAVKAAWYRRRFEVPRGWEGRRVVIQADAVQSWASVYVDGRRAGDLRFPGGELEITPFCRPGSDVTLDILVKALPLKAVMLTHSDSASEREVEGVVPRRGLCGDVFVVATPAGPRIDGIQIATSVRRREITFETAVSGLVEAERYRLRARIVEAGGRVQEWAGEPFGVSDLAEGREVLKAAWMPAALWDLHTPSNLHSAEVTLERESGGVMDVAVAERFGFREFWIDGRDFYLNGTRIYLSVVPLDLAQISAATATYGAAMESLRRLKDIGINAVYTHNYDCQPGAQLGFEEILRAADDLGMLVSFSMPHFSHYDWKGAGADPTNGYAGHAEAYRRMARNHPSVVMYSMSHNATGYNEDMNPDLIDGIHEVRDTWSARNAAQAVRAEAIVRRLDPSRVIYHHASGNLGTLHAINFYPNFAPIQELSDWFEHWSEAGVKPVFLDEYGAPFSWDWTMYRGWHEGRREFGSAAVPWEFCLAEWNAQFLGDAAFKISEAEKTNLRWEAAQFRAGKKWHRWDYPHQVSSTVFDERYPVFAKYLTDNWRAFRGWGVSALSPWEYGHYWKLREGLDRRRRELAVDWDQLQRPGFSPDFIDQPYERMDLAYERTDWIATPAAEALIRNNRPLLAYIGGRIDAFTSKDHVFEVGEVLEKQAIVINNSREEVSVVVRWETDLPVATPEVMTVRLNPGDQRRLPLRIEIPGTARPGSAYLRLKTEFEGVETQEDVFAIQLMGRQERAALLNRPAVFDPRGDTLRELRRLGIDGETVTSTEGLATNRVLIIGRGALKVDGPGFDLKRVRDGLRVIVFEQETAVLERRLGFRVTEYGLRQVFPRIPDHPILEGLDAELLRDWRGAATLLPPRSTLTPDRAYNGAPTTTWCGLRVPRLWRCGHRGSVASVLIEKPARGDFLPMVDGGFSLQFSPLLEYREGAGAVWFCQLDVTGRTEAEPAAGRLMVNLVRHAFDWRASAPRRLAYVGEEAGRRHLEKLGLSVEPLGPVPWATDRVVVVGPGGGKALEGAVEPLESWLKAGGRMLTVGLGEEDLARFLKAPLSIRPAEHISTYFDAPNWGSPWQGVGAADGHLREPREVPLVVDGAERLGDGWLATREVGLGRVVLCQVVPWSYGDRPEPNVRRTYRRTSYALTRLLANQGVILPTPLLERFGDADAADALEGRWLRGYYLDQPEAWDDPYRFFRW
ncbi:MAG: hypothetical protein IT581_15380 [Verrucomicrobiales bacterium]|nr:hypothetical protein [Verrucomicrobiales bacterium]